MIVYILLLIWVLLCSVVKNYHLQYGNKLIMNGRTFYLWLAFFAIGAVMAIRSPNVGTDTVAATNSFCFYCFIQ